MLYVKCLSIVSFRCQSRTAWWRNGLKVGYSDAIELHCFQESVTAECNTIGEVVATSLGAVGLVQ